MNTHGVIDKSSHPILLGKDKIAGKHVIILREHELYDVYVRTNRYSTHNKQ